MSSPNNKFNDFFNNPTPAMQNFRPPPSKVVEALMILCLQNNEWYKDTKLRFVMACSLGALAIEVDALKKKGEESINVSEAAFLMVLGDMLHATRQYAGEQELREFPVDEFSRDKDESEEEED